jgi:hypothetical protein
MKTNYKLALAMLAGVLIGVAGAKAIRAQQVKIPPAYVIAEVDVVDTTTFQKYADKVPQTLAPFHGQYLVRGGRGRSAQAHRGDRFR